MRIEKSAGAVLFIKKNSEIYYLLLNYPAGHWDFSKGRIEKGEEKIKTARREIKEETNISEINMYDSFKKEIKYNYKVHGKLVEKTVTFFIAQSFSDKIKLSFEHKDYTWLKFDDALNKITYNNSKQLLVEANNFINTNQSKKY